MGNENQQTENYIVGYNLETVNNVLNTLNTLKISGVENMEVIISVIRTLQNPVVSFPADNVEAPDTTEVSETENIPVEEVVTE